VTCFRYLLGTPPDELVERRYARFRMFGSADQQPVLPKLENANE
jgi:hypothetical protein